MNNKTFAWLVLSTATALVEGEAFAVEALTPFQPGATTGTAAGALPPPGLYARYNVQFSGGQLKNSDGDNVDVHVRQIVNTPALLWSTDYQILGGRYGAAIAKPLSLSKKSDATGIGGEKTHSKGTFNTVLTPIIISWNLGAGFFTSAGLGIYFPDGTYRHKGAVTSSTSYANNYWTLEPKFGVSYLKDGWNLSLNTLLNFNSKNTTTDYRSGNLVSFDATATKNFGQWSAGLVGNYTKQFTDDRQSGEIVDDGHRVENVLLGPYLGYDFGPAQTSVRYLKGLHAENGINVSFLHVSVAFKI